MSIKIGNQILAKSSTYHPDLFDVKWSDHILNNASWLRADTFSWQSGKIFQRAYEHLVSDLGERTSITYYGWTNSSDVTLYTTTETPQEGDILYRGTPIAEYLVIDDTAEITDIYIKLDNTASGMYTRDPSTDFTTIHTLTETIAGVTISYYQARDGHKIVTADQEENILELYKKTGIAWYYIVDMQTKQFKLPRTKFAFVGVDDKVGKYVKPGLPNITGSVGQAYQQTTINGGWHNYNNCGGGGKGALRLEGTGYGSSCTWSGYSDAGIITLNASRSNEIYGSSTTVQAPSTQMYLYFYIGEFTQTALENTAGINEELFNGKADIEALDRATAHVIIEFQEPTVENNYTWYRKYADGWVEQGGKGQVTTNGTGNTFSLPVAMVDTNYTIVVAKWAGDTGNVGFNAEPATTTTFRAGVAYTSALTRSFTWQVSGKAA